MKRKKTLLISAGIALSCLCAGFIAVGNMTEDNTFVMNADKVYTMNLGKDNGFTNGDYSLSTQTKTYGLVTLNGFLAKANANGFAKLAPNGAIYNYSASGYGGRVTSIRTIKATFTGGALKMRVSRDLSGKIFTDAVSLTSGEDFNVSIVSPYYFILEAGDQEVDIASLEISYACADRDVLSLYQLGKVYTGEKDGVVYKAVINGTSSTIDTLNKAINDHYNCSVALDGEQIKFTIDGAGSLYFNPNEGRNKLTVDSSKGIGAMFAGLSFDEVFTVDDFENMVQGSGYDDVTKSFTTMTGLRAKFLADFNNSEASRTTSPLGWKLMGSSDYLTLASGTGRNGSNAAVFKVSNTSGLRYVTMSSLYNIPRTMGKGNTFSFWAHGPVTPAGAAASKDAKIKVRLFFKNPITGVNDSNGEATELTVSAGSDWTHFEIPLNSSREYYGYCIYSNSASQYLPIDDVEIYTANPYAVYEEQHNYKSFTGKGDVTYDDTLKALFKADGTYLNLGISKDGYSKAYIIGQTFIGTSYDVDESTKQLTIEGALVQTETVTNYGLELTGITGTFNDDYSVLSNVTLLGSTGSHIANNGSITISAANMTVLEDFTGATKASMQSTYARWYMPNSTWTEDTGNDNRFTVCSTDGYNDDICMKVRGYTKYSVTLKNGFPTPISAHGFGFWVKNTSAKALKTRYFSYKSTDYSDGATWMEVQTVNKADGWTLVTCDFQGSMAVKENVTNIRLYFEMSGGGETDFILLDHFFVY